jgi:hypothetical protein
LTSHIGRFRKPDPSKQNARLATRFPLKYGNDRHYAEMAAPASAKLRKCDDKTSARARPSVSRQGAPKVLIVTLIHNFANRNAPESQDA